MGRYECYRCNDIVDADQIVVVKHKSTEGRNQLCRTCHRKSTAAVELVKQLLSNPHRKEYVMNCLRGNAVYDGF